MSCKSTCTKPASWRTRCARIWRTTRRSVLRRVHPGCLKEYAEANITCALIRHQPLPTPQELDIPPDTYLNGLAEVVGEMRRRCLDMLRQDNSDEAERLLGHMDDIYSILVTMDYPDAITNGLRRQTDVIRAIIERTRGDLTFSLRGEHLEASIAQLRARLPGAETLPSRPGLESACRGRVGRACPLTAGGIP